VLDAVPVEGDTHSQAPPGDAEIVQGLGCTPFHEGLLADREQLVTTALPFLPHDSHTGLVGDAGVASFASAAAAKVKREFFYLFARLRVEGDLPYRHPAVVAGVRVIMMIMIFSRWVRRCARLVGVHRETPSSVGRVPGCSCTAGAIYVSPTIIPNIY
jgi:hypothetical protein